MALMEMIVQDNLGKIADRHILEIACGPGHFSLACEPYAASVTATDVELSALDIEADGIHIRTMAPEHMDRYTGFVDTLVCFNGMTRLSKVLSDLLDAIMNRTDLTCFLIINTRQMDRMMTYELLMPLLTDKGIRYTINENATYQGITIRK